MNCLKCGRNLKSAASMETGYGPVCYKRVFGVRMRGHPDGHSQETDDFPVYSIPGQITMEEYLKTTGNGQCS